MAGAPLILTFGFSCDAVIRFLKPTMKPLGVFDPADEPLQTMGAVFSTEDFPEPWTCLPFMYSMKIKVYSPEQEETRNIPGFMIRLADEQFVAYNRECPRGKGCMLNFVKESIRDCGCGTSFKKCCCNIEVNNPVLVCCCHMDTYDLAKDGECIRGPSPKRPKQFELVFQGERITIGRLESTIV